MRCREIQELLSLYVDHELDAERESTVEEHLRECPACREALRELELCLQAMRDLPRREAPPGFVEGVAGHLNQGGRWRRIFEAFWQPLRFKMHLEVAGVLATAVVVVIAYQLFWGQRETVLPPLREVVVPPEIAHERTFKVAEAPKADRVRQIDDAAPLLRLRVVRVPGPSAVAGPVEPGGSAAPETGEAGVDGRADAEADRFGGAPQPGDSTDVLEPPARLSEVREAAPALSRAAPEEQYESPGEKPDHASEALLSAIESAILNAGGTLIGAGPGPARPESRVVSFSVPAARYDALVRELHHLGRLEIQEPMDIGRGMDQTLQLELLVHP